MRVFVTGKTGFVGQSVTALLREPGYEMVELTDRPNAMIHLAWAGLPNYESSAHFDNVRWQFDLIKIASQLGVRNIAVAGTCLEEVRNPPPYAQAKTALCGFLRNLDITLKWVRLPYLYGALQRKECLLPRLWAAIERGDKEFHVVNTKLPFMSVTEAAKRILNAMEDDRAQTANLPGALEKVSDFCRRHIPQGCDIKIIEDYPLKEWEK